MWYYKAITLICNLDDYNILSKYSKYLYNIVFLDKFNIYILHNIIIYFQLFYYFTGNLCTVSIIFNNNYEKYVWKIICK